jgi:hypothetical protein
MIVFGLILLLLGYVLGIGVMVTIGWILVVVGAILFAVGASGTAIGGRRYWY